MGERPMMEGNHQRCILADRRAGKLQIIVLLGSYWPGNDAGGPQQSLNAWCRALQDEVDFKVIARDRPFSARSPLVRDPGWIDRGFAQFCYRPVGPLGVEGIAAVLRQTPHDILIANGFFDPTFTLPAVILRSIRKIPERPFILSPRGEFSRGAMELKAYKKKPYLRLVERLGLLDGVWFHAASELERDDITRVLPAYDRVVLAPNVRFLGPLPPKSSREPGLELRLAFLSRIDRKKNLDFALRVLRRLPFAVTFDIYGPISDANYWSECQSVLGQMPSNINVRHMGAVEQSRVAPTLEKYDGMFFPTRGENYGHAIVDAFAAGIPVIISDQTPWNDLEHSCAGWSLPLHSPDLFVSAITELYHADLDRRQKLRIGARRLAERIINESRAAELTREMFRRVLAEPAFCGRRAVH